MPVILGQCQSDREADNEYTQRQAIETLVGADRPEAAEHAGFLATVYRRNAIILTVRPKPTSV